MACAANQAGASKRTAGRRILPACPEPKMENYRLLWPPPQLRISGSARRTSPSASTAVLVRFFEWFGDLGFFCFQLVRAVFLASV